MTSRQFARVDGLGQAGDGAGGRGVLAHLIGEVGGDDDGAGPAALVAQAVQQGRTVPAAHDHVGDHEVGLDVLGQLQRRLDADRLVHLPAAEPQQRGHALARRGRVVDDEGGQHVRDPAIWRTPPSSRSWSGS